MLYAQFATFQGTISSGLIPSAAFVVVPRAPGLDTPPGTDIALASSSGILSASLPARARGMFPTAADDDPFSDPESSLYDYQVMEEAGSVIFFFFNICQSFTIYSHKQMLKLYERL